MTDDAFTSGMTIFQDRFKPLGVLTLAAYRSRNEHLSDAEFMAGVVRAIDLDFMPGPGKIAELARPRESPVLLAEQAFEDVMSAFRCYPWQSFTLPAGGTTRKAIIAAGGVKAMALADPRDAPFVHKRFVEAFAENYVHDENVAEAETTVAILGGERNMDAKIAALVADTTKRIGGGND